MKILAAIALILAPINGCSSMTGTQASFPTPRSLSPSEVPRVIRAIPSYTRFSYSGVTFFNGKLFASSNIGLLEYEDGALSRLYKWYDKDDVISGPWFDAANQSLWAFHNGLGKLIRFDGRVWNATELPSPKEGYTRGDMLRGFKAISTSATFWLEGGNHAWRWESYQGDWINQPEPETGLFVGMAPLKDRNLLIMRHEYTPLVVSSPFNRPDRPDSDTCYFLQGDRWQELPNKTGIKFFTEAIAVSEQSAYLLTNDGRLLRLTAVGVSPIENVGEVEAMTTTTAGHLLVEIRNKGIYEYSDGWQKRFGSPYQPTAEEHWAYLAESAGRVALAITSKPKSLGEGRWEASGPTTLWVSKGNELKAITISSHN